MSSLEPYQDWLLDSESSLGATCLGCLSRNTSPIEDSKPSRALSPQLLLREVRPNVAMYNAVLSAAAKQGALETAESMLDIGIDGCMVLVNVYIP